ncbi:MAG: 23S rRNA (guanosine(2251)-2'-O)-methyltransferase RlmB [Opitutales bacterium]|nr:23S rRNA (guanosine(2251)-2'-O)-methyltransferase RlmB [Opitutales bacterium]
MQKSASIEYLYGLNPAFECLRSGRRKVSTALFNELTVDSGRLKKLRSLVEDRGIPVELVDKGKLHQLTGSKEHQGVAFRVSRYPYTSLSELFQSKRMLLLDNIEDPHNAGAILRSAEVLGFHDVMLPLKGVPEVYPSVSKVSAGAVEFLRIARECNAQRYVDKAIEAGYAVAALDAKGNVDLESFAASAPEKLLLVIGGEDKGVRQYILNKADAVISLEQSGRINSLNASVAAGIAMYRLRVPT